MIPLRSANAAALTVHSLAAPQVSETVPESLRQFLKYEDAVSCDTPVSERIYSTEQAITELRKVYSEEFLSLTEADPEAEYQAYNHHFAYDVCHFVDWFAIQDYKKDGYVRLNRTLRNGDENACNDPQVAQLTRTLMHQVWFQERHLPWWSEQVVYRGEVRNWSDIARLEEGEIFTAPAFMSASENESVVLSNFLPPSNTLKDEQTNVLYEIERTTVYAGPNITDLMEDWEEEVIFLPGSRFVITDVKTGSDNVGLVVKMRTYDVDVSEWEAKLLSLVNP